MRRLLFAAAVFSASIFMLPSCMVQYPKQQQQMQKTITVHGTGKVTAKPDTASITFSVVTQEWVAKAASEANAVLARKVYDAIKENGVSAADIDTSDINIYRQDTYSNGRSFPGRYRVSNNIVCRIKNVSKVSAVIDAAVAAGATEMSGLSFSISDTSSLLREARTKAMQDAQETAALLAGASGCKIGEAVMIQEGDAEEPARPFRTFAAQGASMADTAVSTPVNAGDVTLSTVVTVTYILQ